MHFLEKYQFRSDCPATTLIDLKDYINLLNKNFQVKYSWENIKSCWVTTCGKTIWQLKNEYDTINELTGILGLPEYMPLGLATTIYDKLKPMV